MSRPGHQSLIKVSANERLTEYQVLQGLLIASGDNAAQILARWDAGSIPAFVTKMNAMAKSLGMTKTHFVDPDGMASEVCWMRPGPPSAHAAHAPQPANRLADR